MSDTNTDYKKLASDLADKLEETEVARRLLETQLGKMLALELLIDAARNSGGEADLIDHVTNEKLTLTITKLTRRT